MCWGGGQVAILSRVARVGLIETVTFRQRFGGGPSYGWICTEKSKCPKVGICLKCLRDTKNVV